LGIEIRIDHGIGLSDLIAVGVDYDQKRLAIQDPESGHHRSGLQEGGETLVLPTMVRSAG
jgi:hypothetical protein